MATFTIEAGEVCRALAMQRLTYEDGSWFLVAAEETGRLVPAERIVGVNSAPLFRLVGQAVNALGATPEAKTMGRDIMLTFLELDPEE